VVIPELSPSPLPEKIAEGYPDKLSNTVKSIQSVLEYRLLNPNEIIGRQAVPFFS
jgi:hypothetical protein